MLTTRDPQGAIGSSPRRISKLAEGMRGSMILRIAGQVRTLAAAGRPVCNLTVGDFAPREFGIPPSLRERVEAALRAGETNYPPSNGVPALREAIVQFYREWLGLEHRVEEVMVCSGARPAIYAAFRTLVDPGDRVVFGVPSWNYEHYCQLVGAEAVPVPTAPGGAFLPTAAALEPMLRGARLLVLNSPLNPAGTAFEPDELGRICDVVLAENARRAGQERPLYLLYDQVYWMLTFRGLVHVTPLALRPAMRPYTVVVDAISKAFAATGLRVGWAVGPTDVIERMSDLVGHVGAWAPRAEQMATAGLLGAREEIEAYHARMRRGVEERLDRLYGGIARLREADLPVDALAPMGAIYLSARFALNGMRTPRGNTLYRNEEIGRYLLEEAGAAMVPFQAFGVPEETGWFRLSVGAVSLADIDEMLPRLEQAIARVVEANR